jgi:hypothetical protein
LHFRFYFNGNIEGKLGHAYGTARMPIQKHGTSELLDPNRPVRA